MRTARPRSAGSPSAPSSTTSSIRTRRDGALRRRRGRGGGDPLAVQLDALGDRPVEHHPAAVEHEGAVAHLADRVEVVADQHERLARRRGTAASASSERSWNSASPTARTSSTSRMSGSTVTAMAKPEPHVQAGRVGPHGGVEQRPDAGEVDDLVEALVDLGAGEAEDRPVEVDVLAARQVAVEPGAELEQRRDAAVGLDAAPWSGGRMRASSLSSVDLPLPLWPMTATDSPWSTVKRDVLERVEVGEARPAQPVQAFLQPARALVVEPEGLGDAVDHDRGAGRVDRAGEPRRRRRRGTSDLLREGAGATQEHDVADDEGDDRPQQQDRRARRRRGHGGGCGDDGRGRAAGDATAVAVERGRGTPRRTRSSG